MTTEMAIYTGAISMIQTDREVALNEAIKELAKQIDALPDNANKITICLLVNGFSTSS